MPSTSKDSVVVLLKGGRLPTWDRLSPDTQRTYSQEHVDLMLSVARDHGMLRLEGFKLMSPRERWQRFWVIEFPSLEGAEAWIDAEMAPPYGRFGYYEYYLDRRFPTDHLAGWVINPPPSEATPSEVDPHIIPTLNAVRSSVIVLLFGRLLPGADAKSPQDRGDDVHVELMQSVAHEHGLMRIEAFQLIAPQPDWHRAWVMEFPELAGAEAWMDNEVLPLHGGYTNKSMALARKWAPSYFAAWVPR